MAETTVEVIENVGDDDKSLTIKIPKEWEANASNVDGEYVGEVIYERVRYVVKSKSDTGEDTVPGGGSGEDTVSGGGSGEDTVPGGGSGEDTVSGGGSGEDTVPGGGSGEDTVPGGGSGEDTVPGGGSGEDTVPGGENPDPDKEAIDMVDDEKYAASDFARAVDTLWPDKKNRPSQYAVMAAFNEAGITEATKAEGIKLVNEFMTKEVK